MKEQTGGKKGKKNGGSGNCDCGDSLVSVYSITVFFQRFQVQSLMQMQLFIAAILGLITSSATQREENATGTNTSQNHFYVPENTCCHVTELVRMQDRWFFKTDGILFDRQRNHAKDVGKPNHRFIYRVLYASALFGFVMAGLVLG